MDEKKWADIVADCRVRAFHKFHEHAFRDVHDRDVRFYRALKASSQPIRDEEAVLEWHHSRRLKWELDDDSEG
jgi:hypothetical protein